MRYVNKVLLVCVFALLFVLLSVVATAQLVPTGQLSCSLSPAACPAGGTILLHSSNISNGHAELPTINNHNLNLCCLDSSGTFNIEQGSEIFSNKFKQ